MRIFPWAGWVIIIFFILASVFLDYKSNLQRTDEVKFLSDFQIKWSVLSRNFELSKNENVLDSFQLPTRPLAVWHRPSTGTTVIIASENVNGEVTDNHVLYVRKNGTLRKLYHSTMSYDQEHQKWLNSHLYQIDGQIEEQASAVNLTPNEEYLFAKEYGYGYSPRVFNVEINGLSSRRTVLNSADAHWSPTGRCVIQIGNSVEEGWGFFPKPNDFVYYGVNIDVDNIRDLRVWWKNEDPCEAYVTMLADHFGGMGDTSRTNVIYNYVIGEQQGTNDNIGIREINSLPKDVENYGHSMKDDWQMIMVTH